MKLSILNIMTSKGNQPNGEHYYGTLTLIDDENLTVDSIRNGAKFSGVTHDVKRKMTKEDAEYLSKKDNAIYNEGEETFRFNTKQGVIDSGITLFNNLFFSNDLIIFHNKLKNHIILEDQFYEYLMTNDENQQLLLLKKEAITKHKIEEWYKRVYKTESDLEQYPNTGLKYICVQKEHPSSKYKYGQIFQSKKDNEYNIIITGIIDFGDVIKYNTKPTHCEGHTSSHEEDFLDEHYKLIELF